MSVLSSLPPTSVYVYTQPPTHKTSEPAEQKHRTSAGGRRETGTGTADRSRNRVGERVRTSYRARRRPSTSKRERERERERTSLLRVHTYPDHDYKSPPVGSSTTIYYYYYYSRAGARRVPRVSPARADVVTSPCVSLSESERQCIFTRDVASTSTILRRGGGERGRSSLGEQKLCPPCVRGVPRDSARVYPGTLFYPLSFSRLFYLLRCYFISGEKKKEREEAARRLLIVVL